MCNFGGSSTNTNQIIGGQRYRDPNKGRLSIGNPVPDTDINLAAKPNTSTPKKKSKLTTSDTYQG